MVIFQRSLAKSIRQSIWHRIYPGNVIQYGLGGWGARVGLPFLGTELSELPKEVEKTVGKDSSSETPIIRVGGGTSLAERLVQQSLKDQGLVVQEVARNEADLTVLGLWLDQGGLQLLRAFHSRSPVSFGIPRDANPRLDSALLRWFTKQTFGKVSQDEVLALEKAWQQAYTARVLVAHEVCVQGSGARSWVRKGDPDWFRKLIP